MWREREREREKWEKNAKQNSKLEAKNTQSPTHIICIRLSLATILPHWTAWPYAKVRVACISPPLVSSFLCTLWGFCPRLFLPTVPIPLVAINQRKRGAEMWLQMPRVSRAPPASTLPEQRVFVFLPATLGYDFRCGHVVCVCVCFSNWFSPVTQIASGANGETVQKRESIGLNVNINHSHERQRVKQSVWRKHLVLMRSVRKHDNWASRHRQIVLPVKWSLMCVFFLCVTVSVLAYKGQTFHSNPGHSGATTTPPPHSPPPTITSLLMCVFLPPHAAYPQRKKRIRNPRSNSSLITPLPLSKMIYRHPRHTLAPLVVSAGWRGKKEKKKKTRAETERDGNEPDRPNTRSHGDLICLQRHIVSCCFIYTAHWQH